MSTERTQPVAQINEARDSGGTQGPPAALPCLQHVLVYLKLGRQRLLGEPQGFPGQLQGVPAYDSLMGSSLALDHSWGSSDSSRSSRGLAVFEITPGAALG